MAKEVTTEQLVNEDGVLDEKAAGAVIDAVADELKSVKEETLSSAVDTPVEEAEPVTDPEPESSEDWTSTEDMQELIESLGYSEDDVSEFADQDQFETHVRLLDRELVKHRNRPGDDQERALEADEIARKKMSRTKQAESRYRENGKFAKEPEDDVVLDGQEEFDDRLVAALQEQRSQIAELKAQIEGSGQQAILNDFDTIVDSIGMEDLFGNSEDMTPTDKKQRARLFEEYKEMFNHLEAQGRPVDGRKTNRAIILRAAHLEFAEEIKQKHRRDLTSKVKRQSRKITGSKSRKSQDHYDGPREKDPYLIEMFNKMAQENG
jgi:hypothetical protein